MPRFPAAGALNYTKRRPKVWPESTRRVGLNFRSTASLVGLSTRPVSSPTSSFRVWPPASDLFSHRQRCDQTEKQRDDFSHPPLTAINGAAPHVPPQIGRGPATMCLKLRVRRHPKTRSALCSPELRATSELCCPWIVLVILGLAPDYR